MRTIRLIGTLLLVAGCFIATRGATWQFGYVFFGVLLLGSGIIILASGRPAVTAETAAPKVRARRPVVTRPGRLRRTPSLA